MDQKDRRGFINGILMSVSYATVPLFTLPILDRGVGVNSILFYRYIVAVLIYYGYLKLRTNIDLRVNRKEFIQISAVGIAFSVSAILFFESLKYIESGISCTIFFIYPIIIVFIMRFFYNERISKYIIISIITILTGIILLNHINVESNFSGLGLLLVCLSSLVHAIYMVWIKQMKYVKDMETQKQSLYIMVIGVLIFLFNLRFGYDLNLNLDPKLYGCVLGLAIIPTIISIETTNKAIRLIGATKTAILGAIEPIVAVMIGVFVFNESFSGNKLLGILFIICGVILMIIKQKDKK